MRRVFHFHAAARAALSAARGCRHYPSRSPVAIRTLSSRPKFPPTFPAAAAAINRTATQNGNGLARWYLGMIHTWPVFTKAVTACTIFAAADLSSQMITSGPESVDLIRTLRMASYGLLISGPTLHLWFNFVSKTLPKQDTLTTIKKMVLGQTIYGPAFTAIFFSFNAALQGETTPEIVARLKRDLIPTLKTGIFYWPMCDFVTFRFIPVHLQPLVSNSFSFLWTIYITYMASLQKASTEDVAVA